MMGRAEEGMRNKEKKRCDHLLEVTEMGYGSTALAKAAVDRKGQRCMWEEHGGR